MSAAGRLRAFVGGAMSAMLAGAFFVLALARLTSNDGTRIGALVFGALYGLAVVGLIRLFRIAPWGLWLAGLFAGPVPAALLLPRGTDPEEGGGLWLACTLFGLCLGGLEHARRRLDER